MKHWIFSIFTLLFSCLFSASAQTVTISDQQTVSVVFPFPIVHVDRGHTTIQVQLVAEAKSILLVKAASSNMPATNLSVITADGSVYALRLCYATELPELVVRLSEQRRISYQRVAENILDNTPVLRRPRATAWDISFQLTGVYVQDGVLYFQLALLNNSTIDYPISLLRFSIKDKQRGKRTAVQEVDCQPLILAGYSSVVPAGSKQVIVAAFEQFTIPDRKYFAVQCMESNGGRHLQLKVNNRSIVNAIRLPNY